MSISKRKLKFYSLKFLVKTNNSFNEADPLEKLRTLVNYFNGLPKQIKKIDLPNNRFCFLEEFKEENNYFLGYFISAKTGHKPPLIDEITLEDRENPKEITEGEEEKTHFLIKPLADKKEAILLIEDRRVGVSINTLKRYFGTKNPDDEDFILDYKFILKKDFIEQIQKFERITAGTLFTDKKILGSPYLEFAEPENSMRDEIEIIIKTKRKKSLTKRLAEKFVNEILTGTSGEIKRVKFSGIDYDNNPFILDTDNAQLTHYIEVDLEEVTNVVNTRDIYDKMKIVMESADV